MNVDSNDPTSDFDPPPKTIEIVRRAHLSARKLLAETRSALILVDVTNRFIFGPEQNETAATASVLSPIESLLQAARRAAILRVFVTVGQTHSASDSGPSLRRLVDMGSSAKGRLKSGRQPAHLLKIPDSIAPRDDEVHLHKTRMSAFFETGLEPLLRAADIETIVLAGVASYGCILSTYLDACARGFYALHCKEAVAGARSDIHDAAMILMGDHSRISLEDVAAVWTKTGSSIRGTL